MSINYKEIIGSIKDFLKKIMETSKSSENQQMNNIDQINKQIPFEAEKIPFHSGDVAFKTKSAKLQNEDFCNLYKGDFISVIAIADGVGSSIDAHIASEMAVTNFINEVKAFDSNKKELENQDVMRFWENTAEKMKIYYEDNKEKYDDKSNVLLTTLLTIIEYKDIYLISYLGNGSIWHVRGDFWHFWDSPIPVPWCMSDLMIGHAYVDKNGKNPLYGYLGYKGDVSKVSFLVIQKNNYCGEIFIMTTDGISSPDNLKTGRDSNQKLWVEVNSHIQNLVNVSFADYFKSISKRESNDNQILNDVMERFLKEKTFDDDATVGIIISNKAKEYYLQNIKSK